MNKELDLNLIKILILLEHHRQLKPVAKILGKSEASISKYLTRLREQLGDELFIRHSHDLEPTDYLLRKLPQISQSLEQLEACFAQDAFDAQSYRKAITVALPSSAIFAFGNELMMELMDTFPSASIHLVRASEHIVDEILEKTVDVQLHYFNPGYPKSIYQQYIGYIPAMVVTSNVHKIATIEQACKLPFVLLEKDFRLLPKYALEDSGFTIHQSGTINDTSSLLKVIESKPIATLLMAYQPPIEGYNFFPIPKSYYKDGLPKVVLQYKQSHRDNPLYTVLASIIQKYALSQ